MQYSQGDYSKHYIVEALFKLMESTPYPDITIYKIEKKAGVGRATFYRYFSNKEEVVRFFFDHTKSEFAEEQIYRPRCAEDYEEVIKRVIRYIKAHKRHLQLLCKAHLEYIYFDYVDRSLLNLFRSEFDDDNIYKAAGYAGAITNITLHWAKNDCEDDEKVVFAAFSDVTLGGMKKSAAQ